MKMANDGILSATFLLTIKACIQSQTSPYGICGGQVALQQFFSKYFGCLPMNIIPPMHHMPSFIYHQCYITLATDSGVK
jgi:hypothetical protein